MSLKTTYLGLGLKSPVIVGSSSFTASADKLAQLEEKGAGAVVLKSVFEEQILGETAFLERYNDYPEAADYLKGYVGQDYLRGHLSLITEAKKKIGIPVIASINCQTATGWIDYAHSIEEAGADAIELNIYILPTDAFVSAQEIEARYLEIVSAVNSVVNIPVSVKLGFRFTNVLNLARELYNRGARGAVMFNRFFEPDIDIENITLISSDALSSNSELRNSLRTVGICSSQVSQLDLSVSTGVHTGVDVVKSLLAGAKAVQVCTALYNRGADIITEMNCFVEEWMLGKNFESIHQFCGKLTFDAPGNDEFYQRAQYMKFFPK